MAAMTSRRITTAEVAHVAQLARLKLTDEERCSVSPAS